MTQEQPSVPAPPPPPADPRRRLRELLAVPERDRSDAQWDEIIELEIQLAPGNRIGPQQQGQGQGQAQKPASQQPKKNRPRWGGGRQHPPKK